ncbi:MAG: RiPP maturation radical SAM protein 1 [Acidobacteria bacterium]|nr:RiPP maturation radical SAM protein 1 [Acidobacteriota bacterium]
MTDVLLVSMPFGPLFSPSLGLSLLQPQVHARGLNCRVEYFTLPFGERIGQALYSKIASEHRAMSRAFVGEWIFSHALFDWSRAHDERYIAEVLVKPPSWLGRSITHPPGRADLRAIRAARSAAAAFVDACADRIVEQAPALVGFTSVFQQHLASLALAKRIKARLPGTVIVMGGANCEATMGVETVRQFPFVDAIVSGEADHVFADLAVRVARGESIDAIDDLPGVVTQRTVAAAGPAFRPPTAPAVTEMDALPYPDYGDFFAQFGRSRFDTSWQPSVFVETSRGCWWGERMHCTFCGLNGATMAYRSKSAARALDELTHLATAHPGCDIQVVDNILDLKYFRTLLPELARRKLAVTLFYETKSNLKKDQVRLLRDAGVTTIQPGIESFSDRVLKQMKKGVSGLQNIQLLKWCKELGVEPIWNFLLGFPGESPDDYTQMADLAARVCHLPCPIGVTAIRLDRFSPNFNESAQLGFTKVRPLPFYEFIYDLPDAARRNLAYYFAYDYRRPQDVARYAEPLVRSVHAWKTTWRNAELVSVDLDNRLMIFDTRPRTAAPLTVLTGEDRALYLACDAITEGARLDASNAGRLSSLTGRGLMVAEGGKYLSLAVPIGEYQPSGAAAARLRRMIGAIGTRDRHGVRIAIDAPAAVGADLGRPNDRARYARTVARRPGRARSAPTSSMTAPLTRAHFEMSGANELYVRRSVS